MLNLVIVSPKRELFAGEVEYVSFETPDGGYGIMKDAAPFVALLSQGVVVIVQNGRRMEAYVDDGFACVTKSGVTLLTDSCYWPTEVHIDDDATIDPNRMQKSKSVHRALKAEIAIAMKGMHENDPDDF